ncbi:MAG: hypothetical protein ACJAU6_003723 [Alphaproteobacteria bacterium]|jgi:hypothetical protein
MTQKMSPQELRRIAEAHGLNNLEDAHLAEVERALVYSQSMAAKMPDILVPADEPAHVFQAENFITVTES